MPVRPRLSHGHGSPERQAAMRPATWGPGEQSGCAASSSLCKDTHTCARTHTLTQKTCVHTRVCMHVHTHAHNPCTHMYTRRHTHVHAHAHMCAHGAWGPCSVCCTGKLLAHPPLSRRQDTPRLGPALAPPWPGATSLLPLSPASPVFGNAPRRGRLRLCVRRHSTHPGWEDRQSRT